MARIVAVEAAEPPPIGLRADDDERSAGGERAPQPSQGAVTAGVEDDVVALASVDVVGRVVDDVVRAEGADQVHLAGAAHAGDFRAERLGDLHGEGADASGGADDQHLVPGLAPGRGPEDPAGR